MNYSHLFPTRYQLELESLKGSVASETFKEPSQREDAKKLIKKQLEERYQSGKNKWFFQPLRVRIPFQPYPVPRTYQRPHEYSSRLGSRSMLSLRLLRMPAQNSPPVPIPLRTDDDTRRLGYDDLTHLGPSIIPGFSPSMTGALHVPYLSSMHLWQIAATTRRSGHGVVCAYRLLRPVSNESSS